MPSGGGIMSSAGRSKSKTSQTKTSTKAIKVIKVAVGAKKIGSFGTRVKARKAIGVAVVKAVAEKLTQSEERQPVAVGPTRAAVQFPPEQYDLPVTFDQSGHILTLRQMLQSGACALSLSSLEPKKLVELTSQRIAAKPDFEIAMVGAGLVNKARALKEVAAQSDVGRLLVEIEQRVIQRVLNRATQ